MSGLQTQSLVSKTTKLFIGGDFPRTESGRTMPVYVSGTKTIFTHLCKASRKDLRNAVTAAQSAQAGWASKSAYNKGQILYRMAEMMEGKRSEFIEIFQETLGQNKASANKAFDSAIDALVYFAGWTDKYQQVIGAVNPVSGPHHNFTTPEPVGVVGMIADKKFDFAALVAQIAAIIASGNSLVVLMAEKGAASIAPLSEVFATSDLPKGVINLLTGSTDELYQHFGSHMEIHSVSCQDPKFLGEIKSLGAENMKRIVGPTTKATSLDTLLNFVEYKTVWHPIGH